jgi:hypothetical protein
VAHERQVVTAAEVQVAHGAVHKVQVAAVLPEAAVKKYPLAQALQTIRVPVWTQALQPAMVLVAVPTPAILQAEQTPVLVT